MATTSVAVATMKTAQVTAAGAGLKIVELEIPDPGPGQVRIKVQACGVCHSDAIILEGLRPGILYPRVPGHEVAGVVDALGYRQQSEECSRGTTKIRRRKSHYRDSAGL